MISRLFWPAVHESEVVGTNLPKTCNNFLTGSMTESDLRSSLSTKRLKQQLFANYNQSRICGEGVG